MTSYLRSPLFLCAAALLAACGARSQLRDSSAASAGAGPSSSTVSVSSGGGFGGTGGFGDVGGSGGMLAGCVVDGPPIGLAGTEGYSTSQPELVTPLEVESTTLLAAWKAEKGPMTGTTELRHTSFQAWGAWPADGTLGPSYLADYDGAPSFTAAPSLTDLDIAFATPPPGAGLTYLSHVVPGSGALGFNEALGSGDEHPLFLERGADPHVHLLGFASAVGGFQTFNIARKSDGDAGAVIAAGLGCGFDPLVAGAAPVGEDFLVAFSSGSPFLDAACSGGPPTKNAADRLFIARVDKLAKVEVVDEITGTTGGDTILSVSVVPRLDGAWVVWTDTFDNSLRVVRLGSSGKAVAGPFQVPFVGDPVTISATNLGDRLALAWSVTAADATWQVQIAVVSTAGNVDAARSINIDRPARVRTAILGSPSSTSLLVAWAQGENPGPWIRMARLACSLP